MFFYFALTFQNNCHYPRANIEPKHIQPNAHTHTHTHMNRKHSHTYKRPGRKAAPVKIRKHEVKISWF